MRLTGKWATIGMAALALLAAPLVAQEPEPETTEVLVGDDAQPLAGWTPEQVADYFTQTANKPEVDAQLAPMIEELLGPGEPVPGWRESGVDILAELGALEGGLSANLLRDGETAAQSVSDLSGKAAPDLSGFSRLALRASPPGRIDARNFINIAPGMWLEMAMQRTVQGNALCNSGLPGVTLHSKVPVTEQSMGDLLSTIVAVSLNDRLVSREVCLVYARDGDGYRALSFLPDGRSLPLLDADAPRVQIMPASELTAFIRNSVPAQTGE